MNNSHHKVLLIIKDGWGYRKETSHNAVATAHTPFYDSLMSQYPVSFADASGEAVGLPAQTQGNSEVGHTTLGAGRILDQALVRINRSITDESFYQNDAFIKAINHAKQHNTDVHLMGLLQSQGVHAHTDHLYALLETCRRENFSRVHIHVFLDGRDALPHEGINLVHDLEAHLDTLGFGTISTIAGRYWAMDRNKDWEVTAKAALNIRDAVSDDSFDRAGNHITRQYESGTGDEFITPTKAVEYNGMQEEDSVIFWNYRTDRARQLSQALIEPSCEIYNPHGPQSFYFVAMTEYYDGVDVRGQVAFAEQNVPNTLSETVSRAGLSQLKITETVKFAHVTFFFNNGVEQPWPNEERILVRSPQQQSQADTPEMCAEEITLRAMSQISNSSPDLIVLNYPNPDMVGHSGDFDATVKAVEFVDTKSQQLIDHALAHNYRVVLTADHGNAEDMGDIWKNSHTLNQVPVHVLGNDLPADMTLRVHCGLRDIAPTILDLMNIPQPKEMTGQSIIHST